MFIVTINVIGEVAFFLAVWNSIRHEVIESMVAPLKLSLEGKARLFKQVSDHVSSRELASLVEPDTNEFTKSGGVVISHSLGISPGLKNWVGLDNLVLKTWLTLLPEAPILAK